MELEADAKFVEALGLDDPRLFSLFEISNAERDQEGDAGFTPGPCQAEYLARSKRLNTNRGKPWTG